MWITELDIDVADVTQRADILDDLMTLYFSRSIVGGVLLWGFSDNHGPCRDTCSLFEGDDFVVRENGVLSNHHIALSDSCDSFG